jgi:hypothetical protein
LIAPKGIGRKVLSVGWVHDWIESHRTFRPVVQDLGPSRWAALRNLFGLDETYPDPDAIEQHLARQSKRMRERLVQKYICGHISEEEYERRKQELVEDGLLKEQGKKL